MQEKRALVNIREEIEQDIINRKMDYSQVQKLSPLIPFHDQHFRGIPPSLKSVTHIAQL